MTDQVTKPSRFWWLRQNKFFESTPLAGYAFIHNAKRLIETFLWYAVLIAFTIFTAINTRNLLNHYRSNPTKTEVRISSNAIDATIKNFTLRLKLPLAELQRPTVYWDPVVGPLTCAGEKDRNFLLAPELASVCLPIQMYPLIKNYHPNVSQELIECFQYYYLSNKYCSMPVRVFNRSKTTIIEKTDIFMKKLDKFYSENLTEIWQNMSHFHKSPNGSYAFDILTSAEFFTRFLNFVSMADFSNQLYYMPYLLLSAMSGKSSELPFLKLINTSEFFQTEGLEAKQFLEAACSTLLNLVPLKLGNSDLFLRNLSIDFKDKRVPFPRHIRHPEHEFEYLYNEFGETFTLEYQVQIPPGVQQLSIDVYPPKHLITTFFLMSHMDKFLFERFFDNRKNMSVLNSVYHLTKCELRAWGDFDVDFESHWDGNSTWSDREYFLLDDYFYEVPRKRMFESLLTPFLDFYQTRSELQLITGSGYISMQPFANYRIIYLPIGQIISQTDGCTSMDLTECLDVCQSNFTLSTCSCYEWNLHYLHQNSEYRICIEPCPGLEEGKKECSVKCEAMLAHPCNYYIYRYEILSKTSTFRTLEEDGAIGWLTSKYKFPLTDNFKLFTVNIDVEQLFTFAKTIETYEMSFTQFLSEFGGLLHTCYTSVES